MDRTEDTAGPGPRLLQDAAATFAMLAATTRLHIVWLLARSEQDVTALAEATGSNVAAVSQHLAKLKLAGLVSSRREGRHQVYVVDDPHVVAIVRQMLDHHAEQAGLRAAGGSSDRGGRDSSTTGVTGSSHDTTSSSHATGSSHDTTSSRATTPAAYPKASAPNAVGENTDRKSTF